MSQNEVTKAIFSILEKELKNINKLIPVDILKKLEKNIAPELNNVIEKIFNKQTIPPHLTIPSM